MTPRFRAEECPLIWVKCGDTAVQKSLDWDSEMEVCCVEEEVSECVVGHLRYVIKGPLWVSVRVFLVLERCSFHAHDGSKMEHRWAVWPFADLFLFLMKKDGKKRPLPPSEWPRVRYDYRQFFGFDPDASWSCFTLVRLPYLTAQESGPERALGKVTWLLDSLWYCVEPVPECFWTVTAV